MIVLSGKKRSGKDTVAGFMREEGMKTYALADPIKEALFHAFRKSIYPGLVTRAMLNGIDYDREQPMNLTMNEVRDILIEAVFYTFKDADLGPAMYVDCIDHIVEFILTIENPETFSIRKFMQTFGTDIMCNIVSNQHWLDLSKKKAPVDAVITDVRQPWEEEYFREQNATFVFVIGAYPGYVEPTDTHITEQGLTPQDGDEILINKDILTLAKETKCLLKKLMN